MIRSFSLGTFILLVFALLVFWPDLSIAQFTSGDYTHQKGEYYNYSGRNYENYSLQFLRRKFFDSFGNYLVDGLSVFDLSEDQRQSTSSSDVGGTSTLTKTRYYQNYFNNLVIVNDYYGGFSTRLMIGDAIRTKFTSLTLDKARFNGVRWDGGTDKYRATALVSRISDPIRFSFESSTLPNSVSGISRVRKWTEYLFGGHFETDIGDIATVGATYVNQHQQRADLSSDESSFRGVVANAIPRVVFLRVSDDSPGDNSGPRIFSAPSIEINGIRRATKLMARYEKPPQSYSLERSPIVYYTFYDFAIDQQLYSNDTLGRTNYYQYSTIGQNPSYPFDVAPTFAGNVTYAFVMPEQTNSLSFYIPLANDYKVEMAHDYIDNDVRDEYKIDNSWISPTADSLFLPYPKPTFFRTIKEAEGNVKDGSNKRMVRIDYGLTSGMSVYGLNVKFHWNGFKIDGEYTQSLEFFKYPVTKTGNLFDLQGAAWYVRGSKEIGRLTIGGEIYKIEPSYTTALNIWTLDNSYFSFPAYPNLPFPLVPDISGYDGASTANPPAHLNLKNNAGGAYFALVDDNDDNDRWEDGFYHYNVYEFPLTNRDVLNPTNNPNFFRLGYRQNVNELQPLDAIIRRPDAGIFPGRDSDGDGIPDDDRNSNGIPDYSEDFLTYYTDQPFFLWGDDWNNNGVIDSQENDILPDYPYPLDQEGYHLFSKINLAKGFDFATGFIREKGIAKGGSDDVNYGRFFFETASPRFGALTLFYVAKRVHDNIPNNVYLFPANQITASQPIPTYSADPLYYRNSMVHNIYVGLKFTQVKYLTIENTIRVELNSQYSIGNPITSTTYIVDPNGVNQQPSSLRSYGVVSKIDYVIPIIQNRLIVTPQFKVRSGKQVRVADRLMSSGKIQPFTEVLVNAQEVIPIMKLDYRLTDNTDLRFGVQGFSLFGLTDAFEYQYRDFKNDERDNVANTTLVAISNRSQYAGYNLVVNFGFKLKNIEYQREIDKVYSGKQTELFFSLFAGF